MKRVLIVCSVLGAGLSAWILYVIYDRPSLEPYANLVLGSRIERGPGLHVTFFGVSTLLFDDGETAILTDGFFSRPGYIRQFVSMFAPVLAPDRQAIDRSLQRAGIEHLAAVIATHSHADHVMDAPEVVRRTGRSLGRVRIHGQRRPRLEPPRRPHSDRPRW